MIQKLRRNFIIITMSSVALVLAIILTMVVIFSYNKSTIYADKILDVLVENDGSFDKYDFKDIPIIGKNRHSFFRIDDTITAETQFESRYISISYEFDPPRVIDRAIRSLDDGNAIEMANQVLREGKERGYINNYRYILSEEKKLVIFINNERMLGGARNTLNICMICFLTALGAIFILVFSLSGRFISPSVKSYEKQKRFITDAGHELKTPLTIISANNEILELEHGENESTIAISNQVDKMKNMVKNLTALATIDEQNKKSKYHSFSISNALLDITNIFKPLLESNNKKFNVDVEDNIDYLGNESLIRELFNIILENANKYSLSFTNISLKKIKNNIIIKTTNDANDIVDGNNDKYFERFYRSDEARKISGSGIGLAIAYEIVESHKGKIHAFGSSKDNTFEIEIVL